MKKRSQINLALVASVLQTNGLLFDSGEDSEPPFRFEVSSSSDLDEHVLRERALHLVLDEFKLDI